MFLPHIFPANFTDPFPGYILPPDLLLPIHVLDANLHRSPVSFQLLDLGQLHDCSAHVAKTLGCQVGAGDVLLE